MLHIKNPITGESKEWHISEPLPHWVADWRLLEFEASGEELTTILEALIRKTAELEAHKNEPNSSD